MIEIGHRMIVNLKHLEPDLNRDFAKFFLGLKKTSLGLKFRNHKIRALEIVLE